MMSRALTTAVIASCLWGAVAEARTAVFVHGRNQGIANTTDYWHIGNGTSNDGIVGFTGNNVNNTGVSPYGNYVYAYDATQSWHDSGSSANNTMPVCALMQALYNTPTTDNAVIGHSAGGLIATYLRAMYANGTPNNCVIKNSSGAVVYSGTAATNAAAGWMTSIATVAAPFKGTELANAVYGNYSGNFLQQLCQGIAASVTDLFYTQQSNMTYDLRTNSTLLSSATAYGTFSAVYPNAGTSTDGDDSAGQAFLASCGNLANGGPRDGIVGTNSALGCANGTATVCSTDNSSSCSGCTGFCTYKICLPNVGTCTGGAGMGCYGWYDAVGHSSSRRDDYHTFASNVWNYNPY